MDWPLKPVEPSNGFANNSSIRSMICNAGMPNEALGLNECEYRRGLEEQLRQATEKALERLEKSQQVICQDGEV